jgi:DNA-binding transcriptional ArsR family regulator
MKPDRNITELHMAKALSHPLRMRILAVLDERVASPKAIALEIGASLGVVSYHVRTLLKLGLLELVDTQPRRGATEHFYRAIARPVLTDEAWSQMPTLVKKGMVGAALNNISEQVNAASLAGGFERDDAHLTRSPLVLDVQGYNEVAVRLEKLLVDLERIGEAAEKRLKKADHADEVRATAVLMLFETAEPEPAKVSPRTPARRSRTRSHTGR